MQVHAAQWLLECADRLNPEQRFPFDVTDAIRQLGIDLAVERTIGTGAKCGEARRNADGSYRVVVFDSRLEAPRTRFTLAHELGHVLLDRAFGLRAANDAEYWQHEDWCNRFAAQLLVPSSAVKRSRASASPNSCLSALWKVSAGCCVSAEVAARRLVETMAGTTFLALGRGTDAKGRDVFRVRWVASSDSGVCFSRRQNLSAHHPLAVALQEQRNTFELLEPARSCAAALQRMTVCLAPA